MSNSSICPENHDESKLIRVSVCVH
ncbi:hypothetical protein NC653_015577 [Populus alba x Populus x berolinensis]|uniref:Uncharacterized protein n=1 Tax=Populus alba x Populus x berolinensis TaxID=444605 RepID=A0AAD6QKV9_9ROSI|nr:hypothetical protein NC653_015577 [Populus alba x Populus x berolinensis]